MKLLCALSLLLIDSGWAWAQVPAAPPQPVVTNPSFEAGGAGWNIPRNAAIVADEAFAGQHSVRLTVTDPRTDAVYITQQVPIVVGSRYVASCHVKTSSVVQKAGAMSSVGAGLIVEWADKQGKWYASGSYATGLFGDHAWTERRTDDLRAPEQAGFAVIFLALRGAGTAWFDDLELKRVERTLTLESPAAGASLNDNTPALTWHDDPQADSFTIELSRDVTFPVDATMRFDTMRSRFAVPNRLGPGRWYWRASAPGYDPGESRSFEQTAPLTADTPAPEVTLKPTRVTRADEPVHFQVTARGLARATPPVEVKLGDRRLEVRFRLVKAGEWEATVQPGWDPGLSRLTMDSRDPAGNVDTYALLVLYRPVPDSPVVIAPDGAYVVGGKRSFPIGIYQVKPQFMPKVRAAGFDVVHDYQFESSQDDGAAKAYLDAAHAAGLRVFIGFDRGIDSHKGLINGNPDMVMNRVAALCDHPGLFCWYLFDEPEAAHHYVSSRGLIAYADLIRQLDPYHAVVVTTWGPRMAQYRPSFDTHWTQAYTTPDGVVRQIEEHRQQLGPQCPITLIAHCFDEDLGKALAEQRPVELSKFQPDAAWMRASAFAGVTQRINGLWWWWFAGEVQQGSCGITVADAPGAWQGLAGVLTQIKALEPLLASPIQPVTGSVKVDGGMLYWWRKTIDGLTTAVAVNITPQSVRAAVPLPGAGDAEVLFEGRRVRRDDGASQDDFGRYGVHVYRFAQ